ncbi:alpha/beta hydrolase [Streptomyces sp. NPDC051987]|uniref:alpha/beta hydrolase n=1 Tax=Streptomyces sp. NPDC051987 TaxID=3155808 RepID=UPI003411FF98
MAITPAPERPLAGPPPLDAELAAPLRAVLDQMPMPLTADLVADRRRRSMAGRLTDEQIRRGGRFEIEERTVPGPPGAPDVPLLVCRPTGATGPSAVIYHTHGGGMVAGSHRSTELAGELDRAQELGLAVVSVDYRLAPEHPDPAPVEDCWAGLGWLADRGPEFGLDPDRIVLSGNSAGGALAAGLALLARDRGGVRPLGQLLQFPMLDDRCATDSHAQLERAGLWDGASNRAGWTALLGERRGTADVSCYAAPARAGDLSGLAPAYLEVGSVEALRDEGIAYASRIWRAGGRAELHVWSGAFHSFDEWVPRAEVSAAAHRARVSWLRRLLGTAGPR